MLPKHRRVRRSGDFSDVVRTGARAATGCLVVHVSQAGTLPARGGLVVGRSVGGSVTRHRVSRRLRHCLRSVLPDLPPGTVVVVRALPSAADADFHRLRDEVGRGVRRALRTVGRGARTHREVAPS